MSANQIRSIYNHCDFTAAVALGENETVIGCIDAYMPGEDSVTIALLQPTMGVLFIGVWMLVAHIVVGDRRTGKRQENISH